MSKKAILVLEDGSFYEGTSSEGRASPPARWCSTPA